MRPTPALISFLKDIEGGHRRLDQTTVRQALDRLSYVRIIGHDGSVLVGDVKVDRVAKLELTKRGKDILAAEGKAAPKPLSKATENWISLFKRCCRNIPKGLRLSERDGSLVAYDDKTEVAMAKVPWNKP